MKWCWHKWDYYYEDGNVVDGRVVAHFGQYDRLFTDKVCRKCGKHYTKIYEWVFGTSDWMKSIPIEPKADGGVQ